MTEVAADLVQSMYDAAGSEVRLRELLGEYALRSGGIGASLVCHDFSAGTLAGITTPELEGVFARNAELFARNPYGPPAITWPSGTVTVANRTLPKSRVLGTAFYQDFVLPERLQLQALMIKLADEPDPTTGGPRYFEGITVIFSADRSDESIERTLPHHRAHVKYLMSALMLHRRLVALEVQKHDLLCALDLTDSAVAICDGRGKVQVLSPSAARLLSQDDGLTTRGAVLVATEERCHGTLTRALWAATRLTEQQAATPPLPIQVHRPSGRPPYELLLCPVARCHDFARKLGGRVLVFIHDPDALEANDAEVLAQRFGLTPSEARVLQVLQLGGSTEDMSHRLRIGKETVRTHLKSLFSKTGTRGQVQLVTRALRGLGQLRPRRRRDTE